MAMTVLAQREVFVVPGGLDGAALDSHAATAVCQTRDSSTSPKEGV